VAHEGPGLIADELSRAGQPFDVVRLDRGDGLPASDSIAGLVVMGGPMGVHDGDDHPWLPTERELLSATVTDGKPVLGVCLGAQQLASALGAEVITGDVPEIGLGRVELTRGGRLDPVTGPEYGGLSDSTIPCVHWHQDAFSLPDGAVHLAASRPFPHQAFRWGDRAYGLQFHVEVDRVLARGWEPHLPEGITLDPARLTEVETVGRRLLRRFIQRALAPRPARAAGTTGAARAGPARRTVGAVGTGGTGPTVGTGRTVRTDEVGR
jgi:GMP synthase-like glutamine amidotransferase